MSKKVSQKIIELLSKEKLTTKQLADLIRIGPGAVSPSITRLLQDDYIKVVGNQGRARVYQATGKKLTVTFSDDVLEAVRQSAATSQEVADVLGEPNKRVSSALSSLHKKGVIKVAKRIQTKSGVLVNVYAINDEYIETKVSGLRAMILGALEREKLTVPQIAKQIGANSSQVYRSISDLLRENLIEVCGETKDSNANKKNIYKSIDYEIDEELSKKFTLFKPKLHGGYWLGVYF